MCIYKINFDSKIFFNNDKKRFSNPYKTFYYFLLVFLSCVDDLKSMQINVLHLSLYYCKNI